MGRKQKMKEKEPINNVSEEIETLYGKYFEDVYKYVYREIPHRQMAEDIAQDVFLVAVKRSDKVLKHSHPKRWLLTTAKYKIREFHRKMKRWTDEPLREEGEEAGVEDYRFEEKEWELTALTILNESEWEMIKKYYLCGVPVSELANAEGITENNMRVRLHRIKKKLKNGMQDRRTAI